MELSEVLNLILGGGLLGTLAAALTMRATVRKAKAEALRAEAEAETVRMDNAEHATRILIENIVEPLKKELGETREELKETKREICSTKREMARFRKAVESANGCRYSVGCPVLRRLRDAPKGETGEPNTAHKGQHRIRDEGADDAGDTCEPCGDDTAGEPPAEPAARCGVPPA